jgi:hypothetical protein
MKLHLSQGLKIRDLNRSFQKQYPYLKLEFFKTKHAPQEGTPGKDIVPNSATLIEVTGTMKEGEIDIKSNQKVAEVEQLFQNKFFLPVQIFRKTRSAWIETTKTDNLTFDKQNKMGREACHFMYDEEVLL